MPGPDVGLWLPRRLDAQQQRELLDWLTTFCDPSGRTRQGFSVRFKVRDWSFLGLAPEAESDVELCVATLDWSPEQSDDYSDVDRRPAEELMVGSTGGGHLAHLAVGRVALTLMRRYDALLDLGGLIGPEPWPTSDTPGGFETRRIEVKPFLAAFPGRVSEVGYSMTGDETRWCHVVDDEFFQAWLDHPAFHLLEEWQ